MDLMTADLVVLGAGPGGYVAAIRGAQLGLDTVVVESGQMGGVCLNWGCIPSKALIEAAGSLHRLKSDMPAMGLKGAEGAFIDPVALQAWKDGIVKKLTSGVSMLLKGNKVRVVKGRAKLASSNAVDVVSEGAAIRIEAKKGIIVATGGRPVELPGLAVDGERILGVQQAISLTEIPERLAVIGGGVIGLELGTVFRKLGSKVTAIEIMPSILPGIDPEISAVCSRRLRQLGLEVITSSKVVDVERGSSGVTLKIAKGDQSSSIEADKVLVAVGMKPVTDGLGLKEIGVEVDSRGFVKTDDRCQSSVPGVYAVGDIAGQPMLAHKASFEGEVAAEAIAGRADRTRRSTMPAAIFTDPEIGAVGMTEPEALQNGHEVKVGKFHFAASGKAMALQETHGMVKVVADAATDRVLGVHIAGPHASDLLAEAALVVHLGLDAREAGAIVRAHPTLCEVVAEGFMAVSGEAIHAVRR